MDTSDGDISKRERGDAVRARRHQRKILACNYVKMACQRHIDDLQKSINDKDYPFRFDREKAERACRFVQLLPIPAAI